MKTKDLIKASAGHYTDAMNVINFFLYGEFSHITPEEAISVYVLCQNQRDILKTKADDDSDYQVLYEHFCELNQKMQVYFLTNETVFRCYGLMLTENFKDLKDAAYIEARTQFCQMAEEVSELEGASFLWGDSIEAAKGN